MTFSEDGVITTLYEDWRIVMVSEGAEVVIVREGTDRGNYPADESTVSVEETDWGSTITVKSQGMEMPFSVNASNYADAPYTCDAASAAIMTPDGQATLTRIE